MSVHYSSGYTKVSKLTFEIEKEQERRNNSPDGPIISSIASLRKAVAEEVKKIVGGWRRWDRHTQTAYVALYWLGPDVETPIRNAFRDKFPDLPFPNTQSHYAATCTQCNQNCQILCSSWKEWQAPTICEDCKNHIHVGFGEWGCWHA